MQKRAICISTQQEVANLLPLLWCGATEVHVLLTAKAKEKDWAKRLERAVPAANVISHDLPADAEYSPTALRDFARSLTDKETPTAFLWGGGTKPMSLGLWWVFEEMYASGAGHCVLYPDQDRGELNVWHSPSNLETIHLKEVKFSLEALLAIHGYEVKGNKHRMLWPPAEQGPFVDCPWVSEAYDLFCHEPELRQYAFTLAKAEGERDELGLSALQRGLVVNNAIKRVGPDDLDLTKAMLTVPENIRQRTLNDFVDAVKRAVYTALLNGVKADKQVTPLPDNEAVQHWLLNCKPGTLSEADDSFARLFEKLLALRVHRFVCAHPELVRYVVANLSFARFGDSNTVGELDVALVTPTGRVIALDAKSYPSEKNNRREENDRRDAQTQRVVNLAGSFGERREVYPAFAPERDGGCESWYPSRFADSFAKKTKDTFPMDASDGLEQSLEKLLKNRG